jgi:hypothetical protein
MPLLLLNTSVMCTVATNFCITRPITQCNASILCVHTHVKPLQAKLSSFCIDTSSTGAIMAPKVHEPKKHSGPAIALSSEEFRLVFASLSLVAGMRHAVSFAIGYMLGERVHLVCQLRRNDFHTDPGHAEFGSVSIRAVNKKTTPRSNWMCSWVEDIFKLEALTIADRKVNVGKRGGVEHASRKESSQWNVPNEKEGQFQVWCDIRSDADGELGEHVVGSAPSGALVEVCGRELTDASGQDWLLVKVRAGPHLKEGIAGWAPRMLRVRFGDEPRKLATLTVVNIGSVPLFPGWEPRDPQCGKRVVSLNPISPQAANQALAKTRKALMSERALRRVPGQPVQVGTEYTLARLAHVLDGLDRVPLTTLRRHSMRHSAIAQAIAAGFDCDLAGNLAGHKPGSTVTKRVYNQATPSRKQKLVEQSFGPCLRKCGGLADMLSADTSARASSSTSVASVGLVDDDRQVQGVMRTLSSLRDLVGNEVFNKALGRLAPAE